MKRLSTSKTTMIFVHSWKLIGISTRGDSSILSFTPQKKKRWPRRPCSGNHEIVAVQPSSQPVKQPPSRPKLLQIFQVPAIRHGTRKDWIRPHSPSPHITKKTQEATPPSSASSLRKKKARRACSGNLRYSGSILQRFSTSKTTLIFVPSWNLIDI